MNKMKKNLFSPTPSVVKRGTVAMLCLMLAGLFLAAGCKKDNPVITTGLLAQSDFYYTEKQTCPIF